LAEPSAWGVPDALSGGQVCAHPPPHCGDEAPLSGVNSYSVRPWPSTRMSPYLAFFVDDTTVPVGGLVVVGLGAAEVAGEVAGGDEAGVVRAGPDTGPGEDAGPVVDGVTGPLVVGAALVPVVPAARSVLVGAPVVPVELTPLLLLLL